MTKEGRQLTYELVVIQQPERARACGSGAKSSADRRPVDPPPVVELRIYEGESKQDITFSYMANFFLYITLENARPIAQGRVPNSQATFPVLTGMPVAGMAYLDRPSPAGYFIFPDLSVRHEGKYRLSFNLFEEQKDPKDADAETGPGSPESVKARNGTGTLAPQAHCHFRLEVKSEPFAVFSAKKFPGLKESTTISRVVSEQGCRVRIRRDVRMRKRDMQTRATYDEYEDEPAYARSDRFITPDSYKPERPRSIGSGGNEAGPSYGMEQHRPSISDGSYYGQGNFQPPPAAPSQGPNGHAGSGSHLAFGNPAAPSVMSTNFPPPIHQPSSSLPGSNEYHPYSAPARVGHLSSLPHGGYNPTQPPQHPGLVQHPMPPNLVHSNQMPNQPMYADNNGYHHPHPTEYRPPPATGHNPGYSMRNLDTYASIEPHHPTPSTYFPQIPASNPGPSMATEHALPPLKSLETSFEKKYDVSAPNSAIAGPMISSTPAYTGLETPVSQISNANPMRTGKRTFDAVFDTGHMNQPLHGGMRPSVASYGQEAPQIEAEDGTTYDADALRSSLKLLSYRRADGRQQFRKCPSPVSE